MLRGKITRIHAAQQQIEFGGLFKFLSGEHSGFQGFACDHRTVIGKQHGGITAGKTAYTVDPCWIAGRKYGKSGIRPPRIT